MEGLPALWVLKHKIKNEAGFPIEFQKRKFLWDIYNDLSPLQVLLKPPQIGATVMNTVKSFYVAKKKRRQIIYTLPTAGDVQDMVGGSINRIIAQNPILMSWVKDHDTVEQKSIGDSMIFYRGTFTAKQAMMIPSGLNIHDEVDASDPEIVAQYETRLQAQEDGGWRWYFSHPSLVGHGVDIYWQQSNKREWYITCPSCSLEQFLTWPDNIDIDRQMYICSACMKELPDEARINGEWRATAEGAFSGYHVTQLMLWNKSAKDIIAAYNDPQKDKQYFYNYVLGLPYAGSDDKIEPSVVLRNCVDVVNPQEGVTVIGADTGHGIHYVMMNKDGVFYFDHETEITASRDPYDVIRGHLKRFKNSIAVFDQGGDLIGVRKLQAEYPGRVFLVFYRKDRKSLDIINWGEGDEYGKVVVDRNRMITLMVEQLRDIGRIRLNGTKEEWQEFANMFGNMYREKLTVKESREKDSKDLYGAEYVWKRSGADHFCFVAGTKILTKYGHRNIEDIKNGDEVLTRNGFKKVYNAGLQRKNQRVLTAYFSNGSSFTATPDHPLITTLGKIRLDSITRHAILYECQNQKVSHTKELFIGVIHPQKDGKHESISYPMERLEKRGLRGFISKYGSIVMEKFLKGIAYIIKMAIRSITIFQTYCVFLVLNTNDNTPSTDYQMSLIEWPTESTLRRFKGTLTTGGGPLMVLPGIVNMLSRVLYCLNHCLLYVLSATLRALHGAIKAVSSAPANVRIVGLHENIGKKDVINISVEDEHEYFANGILVSNCHALLYALVGMQRYGDEMATVVGSQGMFAGIPKGRIVNEETVQTIIRSDGSYDI